jgi:putative transposase
VTDTLELALSASGCESAKVAQRPRLLSDNGSSYIAGDLAEWLEDRGIKHIRGAPFHPQTQGKIERWHQTLKNRIAGYSRLMGRDESETLPRLRTDLA